jgi:predicted GNAT family acetyltransferase
LAPHKRRWRDDHWCHDASPGQSTLSAVTDNPARSRFELELDGATAFIDYQRAGQVFVLTHAEVPPALRGRGLGAELSAGALALVRAQGGKVQARCPFVAQYIASHAQYQDLLAKP